MAIAQIAAAGGPVPTGARPWRVWAETLGGKWVDGKWSGPEWSGPDPLSAGGKWVDRQLTLRELDAGSGSIAS
jgi:hypothetical protein